MTNEEIAHVEQVLPSSRFQKSFAAEGSNASAGEKGLAVALSIKTRHIIMGRLYSDFNRM